MSSKLFLIAAIVAVSVSGLTAKNIDGVSQARNNKWYANGVRFSYDCSGKADGNYPHPTKCTHYVACVAETEAYEMPCADNLDGTLLHYVQNSGPDPATSRCDYPEVAGCAGPEPEPETTAAPEPEPEPANPETTAAPEPETENPNACNPELCLLEGDCQTYRRCEGEGQTGTWTTINCSEDGDLFWNPDANSIHGGVCDYFGNLSPAVQDKYKSDANCIAPCEWFQDDADVCSPNYNYRSPFDGQNNKGRVSRLSCPRGPADSDEALVWNAEKLTCDKCSDVKQKDGSSCQC